MKAKKTALLLVDLQNDFCHPDGTASKRGKNVEFFREAWEAMRNLLEAARKQHIPVFHAISEHSAWTESPSGKERFGRSGRNDDVSYCEPGSWGAEVFPIFQPHGNEPIVTKYRYSAFLHTNLEFLLRASRIEHLVIIGAYTNICIDTTARDAYMRDFYVTIPPDCVVSDNEQLHHSALELLEGTFAELIYSYEIIKQWEER